jgi:hypothetical protein
VIPEALADRTVRDLLEACAAPAPTPGGGSVAALAAASAALVERCASVTPGPRFERARVRAGVLREELVLLADTDSAALASLAQHGHRAFRGEARCAMLLADAAARIAGTIIALNLALTAPEA